MIFVDWRFLEELGAAGLTLGLIALAIKLIRGKRRLIRWPVFVASVPLALAACLLSFLALLFLHWTTYSLAAYSPDGKKAVRVEHWSGFFSTDEGDTLWLVSNYGLSEESLVGGDFESFDIQDVHWIDDRQIEVSTQGYVYVCRSTPYIAVRCIDRGRDESRNRNLGQVLHGHATVGGRLN